jgi:hypothetical protein
MPILIIILYVPNLISLVLNIAMCGLGNANPLIKGFGDGVFHHQELKFVPELRKHLAPFLPFFFRNQVKLIKIKGK